MVRAIAVLACVLIVVMDATAGILGIKAEAAQNQVKHLRLWIFECKEPSHDAFILASAAAIVLGLAHVLANLLGGCSVCTPDNHAKSGSSSRQLSMACLIFLWIIVAVGLSMLAIGILSNKKSRSSCGFTHHHFLSFGGIACFVHALFAVAYIVTTNAAAQDA